VTLKDSTRLPSWSRAPAAPAGRRGHPRTHWPTRTASRTRSAYSFATGTAPSFRESAVWNMLAIAGQTHRSPHRPSRLQFTGPHWQILSPWGA